MYSIRVENNTTDMNINLTDKEQQLLDSIKEGMDYPGCGWLHEISPFSNDHVTAGVLGQLITKGLVTSYQDEDCPRCYWVEIAI